jgi:DNA primase
MVMVNELLVNLVNGVLGTGKRTARGNQSFHCPFCNHHKPKLEVNFTEDKDGKNRWACWACNKKGQTIYSLFKQLEVSPEIISQLKPLVKSGSFVEKSITYNILELPKEFKKFDNSIISKHALNYLKKRNITQSDILKYGMGYCEYGLYSKMIVIPSYNDVGKLNYFTARSFEKDPYIKYRNPETSRDIIPFELFINWDLPIILCEGPFDAMAIKRNVIPLFGKNIQSSLMKKIVSSKVQKIYIALDNDAINKALEFCETLLDEGKEVYLVELEGKDPSEMGFEHFTKLIQKTTPLTNYKLMEKKLQMV